MSDPSPTPTGPTWLSRSVVVLLALQVALLWTHGSMLQRQHEDLEALRDDVQSLTESLDQQDGWDSSEGDSSNPSPARARVPRRGRRLIRTTVQTTTEAPQGEPDDDAAAQELQASQRSAQEAVAKARDLQAKLSLEENARKAEAQAQALAKAQAQAEDRWRRWLWTIPAVALVALLGRSWLRRRG